MHTQIHFSCWSEAFVITFSLLSVQEFFHYGEKQGCPPCRPGQASCGEAAQAAGWQPFCSVASRGHEPGRLQACLRCVLHDLQKCEGAPTNTYTYMDPCTHKDTYMGPYTFMFMFMTMSMFMHQALLGHEHTSKDTSTPPSHIIIYIYKYMYTYVYMDIYIMYVHIYIYI